MLAGEADVARDGVAMDSDEPGRLAGADPLGHVVEDGDRLRRRQPGIEQGRAFAFGEPRLAGGAAEQTRPVRTVPHRHREVAVAPLAPIGTTGIQAAKALEVVHDRLGDEGGDSLEEP